MSARRGVVIALAGVGVAALARGGEPPPGSPPGGAPVLDREVSTWPPPHHRGVAPDLCYWPDFIGVGRILSTEVRTFEGIEMDGEPITIGEFRVERSVVARDQLAGMVAGATVPLAFEGGAHEDGTVSVATDFPFPHAGEWYVFALRPAYVPGWDYPAVHFHLRLSETNIARIPPEDLLQLAWQTMCSLHPEGLYAGDLSRLELPPEVRRLFPNPEGAGTERPGGR